MLLSELQQCSSWPQITRIVRLFRNYTLHSAYLLKHRTSLVPPVASGTPAAISFGGSGVIGPEFNNVDCEVPVGPLSKSCLLFALNLIDAQLTLVWIRLNVATEGNALMARLLEHGDLPFFGAKVVIGGFAAYTLYRCAHLPLAKHGLTAVLGVYMVLMVDSCRSWMLSSRLANARAIACVRRKLAARLSVPSSSRENETRLRRPALIQSVRNGSRFESILKPMLATLTEIQIFREEEFLCTNFPHAKFY